jgi:hypothetical protein
LEQLELQEVQPVEVAAEELELERQEEQPATAALMERQEH